MKNLSMLVIAASFLGSALLSSLLTHHLMRLSKQRRWFDARDHRKNHGGDIPFLGGVAMALTYSFGSMLLFFLTSEYLLLIVLIPMVVVHGLGVYDDFIDISARKKLIVEIVAAIFVVSVGISIEEVSFLRVGSSYQLGWLSKPVTVVWILFVMNAFNLIDGSDGVAGSLAVIAFIGIGIWAFLAGNQIVLVMSVVMVGSVTGFLVFNFPPAKIFMGDGGSLFLGFCAAIFPIVLAVDSSLPFFVPGVISISAVPLIDTVFSVLRRLAQGRPVFSADREHIHHKLKNSGLSSAQTLRFLAAFAFLAMVSAVLHVTLSLTVTLIVLVGLWAIAIVLMFLIYRRKRCWKLLTLL